MNVKSDGLVKKEQNQSKIWFSPRESLWCLPSFQKSKEGGKSGKVGNLVSASFREGRFVAADLPQRKKKFEMEARQEGVLESKGGLVQRL